MDWVAVVAVATLVGGLGFGALLAVFCLGMSATVRRSLEEVSSRQIQSIRQLSEAQAQQQRQLQEARLQIQALTQANRHLAEQIRALGERVGDVGGPPAPSARDRTLH